MRNGSMVQRLPLQRLTLDADIQPRETMSSGLISEYAKLYQEGINLPPIKAFRDAQKYWVADGFHRASAAREAGLSEIEVEVETGTKRDAILYACASNKHGKARTNDDKRRAVSRLLSDDEWKIWSDSAIARHCSVSHDFVRKQRSILHPMQDIAPRVVERNGTTYTMDTSNIGERRGSSVETEVQRETDEFPDDMDRDAIEAAFPEHPTPEIFDALDGLSEELTEEEPSPEPDHGHHISSYVLWINLLRNVATMLEQVNQLGGIGTITKNLTPDQFDSVLDQVHRLDHHVKKLVEEANRISIVVEVSVSY